MILRKSFILLAALTLALRLSSQDKTATYFQDPASNPPDLTVSLKHVKAEVQFKPTENLVIANVDLTVIANRYHTDSISIYTPEFVISKVSMITVDEGAVKPSAGKQSKAMIGLIPVTWKLSGSNLVIFPVKGASSLARGKK